MQKIDPYFIDINLVTSIDLQSNVTDYIDLVETFAEETALNISYWHSDAHSDPITSKVGFYKDINNNEFNLKDNKDGVIKRDITKDQLHNKNYRDQLPDNFLIKTQTGNKYDKPSLKGENSVEAKVITTHREWVPQSDAKTDATGKWETITTEKEVTHPVDPLLDIQKNPKVLQEKFGMKDMSPWFILWWMEKFYTSHDVLKSDLIKVLGDDNEYFVKFSESVGQLKNTTDAYDTSTLPIWDINVSAYGDEFSTPTTTAGVAKYCMQPESLALSHQLSRQTNTHFRANLANMMEDPSKDDIITGIMPNLSTQSHGNNFVNDYLHPTRMMSFVETVQGVLQDHLKGLYEVLDLLSNRENYMVVDKPKQILIKVESFTRSVDILKNSIKSFDLKLSEKTRRRYGKSTSYNYEVYNTDVLAVKGVVETKNQSQ